MKKNIQHLKQKLLFFVDHHLRAFRFAVCLCAALFALGLVYRLRILHMIYTDSAFAISAHPILLFIKSMGNESIFDLFFSAAVFFMLVPFKNKFEKPHFNSLLHIPAVILLFVFSFLYNTSYHFWISMNTGFTRDLLLEAVATTRMEEALHFLKPADALMFIVPLLTYFFLQYGKQHPRWRIRTALILPLLFIITHTTIAAFKSNTSESTIASPPVYYTFLSFFEKSNWNTIETFTQGTEKLQSIALTDPRFVHQHIKPASLRLLSRSKEQWNVLIIIMESIGKQYIFDTSRGNPIPMPFFKQLTEKGLYFDFHYSTGNTSPRSIFSLLSGLYPSPRVQMFCTKSDVVVPSIKTFLGESYDAFFVTPGSLDWFFPKGFLKNSGFKEIYGYKEIPARVVKDTYGKNDIDAVSFFLKRLEKSINRPFVAVYYSFAAHWPYVDYGEEYRIFKDTSNRLNRYFNNIRMLDTQIQRIYSFLEQKGLLSNTVLLIASDHSEAFNQHPGVWVHSRDSYNENFSVPALLYQPRLFRPHRITFPTTHADILPTLLDAIGVHYNEKFMQGESVLRGMPRRKYIFLFGNENTITSISMEKLKLQYSFKDKKCWAYNLVNDYGEINRLSCDPYSEQFEAMMAYHSLQPKILENYNDHIKNNGNCYQFVHYTRK